MFHAISKLRWQIRNFEITNQFRNCAAMHLCAFLKLRRNLRHNCQVSWKAKHILLAEGRITGELKPTLFYPGLQLWVVVHCYGVAHEQSHNLLSLIFRDRFARFDWHNVLCRTLQNAVARLIIDVSVNLHSRYTRGLSSVYTEISKLRCTISKSDSIFEIGFAISKFLICARQFRRQFSLSLYYIVLYCLNIPCNLKKKYIYIHGQLVHNLLY